MLGVATGGSGDASMRVGATNQFDFAHDPRAVCGRSFEKQPGDGSRFRRWAAGENLTFDCAAILRPPDGSCAVGCYLVSHCVEECGFRSLKDPLWRAGGLLADVDLHPSTGGGKDGVLRWRRCSGILSVSGEGEGKN